MFSAPFLSLAVATPAVLAAAVTSSLQPHRHLTARQDEWLITTASVSDQPLLPDDTELQYVDLSDCDGEPDTGSDYPVLVHLPTETTFWALSWIDDREAFAILGFDSEGDVVNTVDAPGARYLCGINFVDSSFDQVAFVGQGNVSVVVSSEDLSDPLLPTETETETVIETKTETETKTATVTETPPIESTETTAGPMPTESTSAVITELQACADCKDQKCEFTDLQRRDSQSYKILVGTPQTNCDGSTEDIEVELEVSETITDTWSASATATAFVGLFRTGVEFSVSTGWSESKGHAISQKTKITINPGQQARFVANVEYDLTEGILRRGRNPVGRLVSNQPNNVRSFAVQVVNCTENFAGEEVRRQPRAVCTPNSSPRSTASRLLLVGVIVGMSLACMLA